MESARFQGHPVTSQVGSCPPDSDRSRHEQNRIEAGSRFRATSSIAALAAITAIRACGKRRSWLNRRGVDRVQGDWLVMSRMALFDRVEVARILLAFSLDSVRAGA